MQRLIIASLVIGTIIACIGLIIASMRRGSSVIGTRGDSTQSFITEVGPQDVLRKIIRFAQKAKYKVSAVDEAAGQLVLEESASAFSWGFFFPISIVRQPNGSSLVEIGIKSKLVQVGPIVSRSHEKCIKGIKAALLG